MAIELVQTEPGFEPADMIRELLSQVEAGEVSLRKIIIIHDETASGYEPHYWVTGYTAAQLHTALSIVQLAHLDDLRSGEHE